MYTQQEIDQFEWHISQAVFHKNQYNAIRKETNDWRTKDARFQLKEYRFHHSQVPFSYIMQTIFKKHSADIVKNVTMNNPLYRRLIGA
jgi:hypothetical protein